MPFHTFALRVRRENADVYGFARTVSLAESTELWRIWASGERFRRQQRVRKYRGRRGECPPQHALATDRGTGERFRNWDWRRERKCKPTLSRPKSIEMNQNWSINQSLFEFSSRNRTHKLLGTLGRWSFGLKNTRVGKVGSVACHTKSSAVPSDTIYCGVGKPSSRRATGSAESAIAA